MGTQKDSSFNLNKENKQQVNIGAALQGRAVGVLEYAYGNYKVKTFGLVAFSENNPVIPRVNTQQILLRSPLM